MGFGYQLAMLYVFMSTKASVYRVYGCITIKMNYGNTFRMKQSHHVLCILNKHVHDVEHRKEPGLPTEGKNDVNPHFCVKIIVLDDLPVTQVFGCLLKAMAGDRLQPPVTLQSTVALENRWDGCCSDQSHGKNQPGDCPKKFRPESVHCFCYIKV